MSGRRCVDRRAALRAEVSRKRVAAVSALRESSHGPAYQEFVRTDANAHIERATRGAPAVATVAVARWPDRTRALVAHLTAEAPSASHAPMPAPAYSAAS